MFSKLPWSQGSNDQHGDQHGQHGQHEKDEEQSLTTVLNSAEDRSNLLILVADCTHAMRAGVCAVFDPQQPTTTHNSVAKHPEEAEGKEEAMGETHAQGGSNEATLRVKQEQEQQRRLQELSSLDMQSLKNAALAHFDDWRDKVLSRVGEAVNHKSTTPPSKANEKDSATAAAAAQPPTKTINDTTTSTGEENHDTALHARYPPTATPLLSLPTSQRALILHSILLLLLSLERYAAESRILLLHLTSSLHVPFSTLASDEAKVAQGLLEAAKRQMTADDEAKRRAADNSGSRAWKVGLGTVAGAALIGVTGGLAAPLLAAGVGSVMGGLGLGATAAAGYLGAMAGSAPLVGALFGAYGGKMAGQSIDRYAKDVDDFAFIPVHEHQQKHQRDIFHRQSQSDKDAEKAAAAAADAAAHRLRVAIGISGWLTSPADIATPWLAISSVNTEPFALRFELDAMMSLGNALVAYVKSYAWGWAKKEIISRTVFGALSAALWPLGLLKVARVVDNPFSVAKARADKAGVVLADALAHRVQGERPVTLVGYSLGARVIYQCLEELAARRQFGLIEDVVLLGAATPSDSLNWRKIRAVVSGRVVNVYSANDYLLAFLYRTASLQLGVARLQAVEAVPGVENVDVSGLVDGHTKYRYLVGRILERVGYEDVEVGEAERQEGVLRVVEAKEKEEREKKEKEEEPEHLEKEAEKGKSEGMLSWVQGKVGGLGFGGAAEGDRRPAAA